MSGKEYVIKYAAMDQLYVMICNRISGWYNELEDWSGEYERLVSMESFSGASAESAKAYLQEVHGLLVSFLQTTLQYYQARLLLYKIGYYDIDASLYSSIPQEILKEVQEKLGRESETLQEVSDSIGRSVNSVSDLIYLKNPSIDNLKNTMDGLKSELGDFEAEIGDYESSELQAVQSDVQGMIDSLQATVLDYLNNGTSIPSYQPGAVAGNTNMLDLYQRAVAAGQYVEEHQEEIELAAAEQEKAFAQMQADYEAACEAREQEGQVKMLQGALAAGVGIAAIVFTGGAATPVVAAAWVTGGCSVAYGVSTAFEGAQDWYLGSIGDLETAAVNPIRDTIFAGNQELYDLWGSLNMMAAGMCIPVGHAVNGAAGLGKGAVIKAVGRTIVTETVKDRAIDYVSGEITTFATEHLNLNQVQSAALNIGLNLGLDKGADWAGQKIGITEGPKFTDRMSYEDAKRYNQFMSEAELGIHNNHPGMSQADLDAWKLADAKVEEQLAVNRVNWDEVIALRAKERRFIVVDQDKLPESLSSTFAEGEYQTIVTGEDITLYRSFGGKADAGGAFATTRPAESRIQAKLDLALLPEWGNSRAYEAEIQIPAGQRVNIGIVAPQTIKGSGTLLPGGAVQILLPKDWPLESHLQDAERHINR